MKLKIDLHVHSDVSPDGVDSLEKVLEAAKNKGLDGIALADHDELSKYIPGEIFVLPACECSTKEGHILALFIEKEPPSLQKYTGRLPSAIDIINEIHALGGVAVLAHPYERHKAVDEAVANAVDMIETVNARVCFKNIEANAMADKLADGLGKPKTGGSDGHSRHEVSNAYIVLDCKDKSLDSIKEAILSGNTVPVLSNQTPRWRKGLSQLAKCRRTGASPGRMAKAYAYIIYCLLLDLKYMIKRR